MSAEKEVRLENDVEDAVHLDAARLRKMAANLRKEASKLRQSLGNPPTYTIDLAEIQRLISND